MPWQLFPIVNTLKFAHHLVGKDGPVNLDTQICAHYDFNGNGTLEDIVVIGKPGEKITLEDIMHAFNAINKSKLYQSKFNSGKRSYSFEGFHESSADNYSIMWGS
jgi:hypothetical protein